MNVTATYQGASAEVIAAWQLARLTPFSVIHGDYRLDNLLFSPTGDGVVVYDLTAPPKNS